MSTKVDNKILEQRFKIPWLGILFFLSALLAILFGWSISEERYIIAEDGLGYALGIVGGSMMLLLLLYPLRKRVRGMRNWAPIRYWFRMHMFCGVFGPILILYHANFSLGSLNSNVALFAMIIVAGSGLFGRYFYTKIHYGLYGQKASLKELKQSAEESLEHFAPLMQSLPEAKEELSQFEAYTLKPAMSLFREFGRAFHLAFSTRVTYSHLKKRLIQEIESCEIDPKEKSLKKQEITLFLRSYLYTLRKIAEFSFYERLFSWWHILHLPLFIMLVISGITHVVATHMY